MYVVRDATPRDLDELLALARVLDTVNLPHDRGVLEELVDRARRSRAPELPTAERLFLFVLEEDGRVVGTSMIHAQHGTRRAPHVYYDVLHEERYSETLDRHLRHRVLRIGYDFDGPTEIGGLVLAPEHRGRPGQPGKVLSFARFLFLAAHRAWFRDQVLAELLPPLEPDGTSRLWEHLGRVFTGGMTYQEADRLSQKNKEFIRALFPQDLVYVTLLPADVQRQIGEVGPNTKGVERMLRGIGFAYANRIDPFDGGPHFVARTDDVSLVRDARALTVSARPLGDGEGEDAIVGVTEPSFRACRARARVDDGALRLDDATRAALGVSAGDRAWHQRLASSSSRA